MDRPDFEAARRYALDRLERELDPRLCYHSIEHTRDDVLPAAERLGALEGVTGEDLLLLRTAAVFHDIGFLAGRDEHEASGARIAAEALPDFGYLPEQIARIGRMIRATKLPQSPETPLDEILADADLELLGRRDFLQRNQALRAELAVFGVQFSDDQWYSGQLAFMTGHRYWTRSAVALLDGEKQRNIAVLRIIITAPDNWADPITW